jgi:hypothetical protein
MYVFRFPIRFSSRTARKDEDNTITEEDFAQLSLRFLRIFLPGLTQERDQRECWGPRDLKKTLKGTSLFFFQVV